MQRVPSVLSKPLKKAAHVSLVPTKTVPHAAARHGVPAEWAWSEAAPAAPAPESVASFAPMGYEPGYAYPLMVWLHCDGSAEHKLPDVMQHVSVRNFVAVAPRGVVQDETGYGWSQSPESIDAASDAVFEAIEAATARFSVHPRRVFIAGAGSGGTMAMRIALQHPEAFGGVATLDGPLPTGGQPLSRVNALRELPLLLSATRESAAYPEPQVCRDLSLLHSAGCRVAIRQYPGDHDLTTAMLADLNRWAMGLVCG